MPKRSQNQATGALRQLSRAGLKAAETLVRLAQENGPEALDLRSKWPDLPGLSLLAERLRQKVKDSTRRKYASRYPWVQPSPISFEGLAPAVLNVPEDEVLEFLEVVVSRYLKTLRRYWVDAAYFAWRHPGLEPLDDAEFVRLLECTPCCRFLNPQLEPRDRVTFARVLATNTGPRGSYFKLDLSALERMDRLPGVHHAATVTLLERKPGSARLTPRAIQINGLVLEPRDGAAWELARYFVLQGAALSLVVGIHPTVHFPMDAINALTKTLLPVEHPVRSILEPHFYLQLPLNYAVLYIDRSVAHNNQREIYTPFPCTKDGFFAVARAYYEGIEGNSSYPAYRFRPAPPEIPFRYGNFLNAYFEVILRFTRKVTWGIRRDDRLVSRWADQLHTTLPGFPSAAEIFEGDTLARTLAWVICDVSVVHSADHFAYAEIPLRKAPLRLRQPAPASSSIPPLDLRSLVTWEDLFRHRMAWEMYFKPTTVVRLLDAVYPFAQPRHQRAALEFKRELHLLDVTLGADRFAPISEIASSIQY